MIAARLLLFAGLAFASAQAQSTGARAAASRPAAISRFQERKAETLLRDVLPCLGCHQLKGEGGRVGPDLSTARQRRTPEYIASMVADPQRTVPGTPMPRVPMSDASRDLITNYLMTRPAGATVTGASTGPATPARVGGGAPALYARFCAACHGADGKGDGPNASYLPVKPAVHASREAMARRSDDALFDAISGGGAVMGKSARMPPFGATLTRAEISSLVRHIRELCRCRGPAWSEDGRAGTRAPQQR